MGDDRHGDCAGRRVLDHLSGRWTVLVLTALRDRPHRYHQLRAAVAGVSDKMLTATLQTLTDDGFVRRDVGDGRPPQVTYSITDLGAGAMTALTPFLTWTREHLGGAAHRPS